MARTPLSRNDRFKTALLGAPLKLLRRTISPRGLSAVTSKEMTVSRRFYFPDGDVVIKINNVLFRVQRSHLANFCTFFAKRFAEESAWSKLTLRATQVELDDVLPSDFETLLQALSNLESRTVYRLSETVAASLLRASYALGCRETLALAIEHLETFWDARHPPPLSQPARPLASALETVALARACAVSSVHKRAMYEVLSTPSLDILFKGTISKALPIDLEDLSQLYRAKGKLTLEWERFVFTTPGSYKDEDGNGRSRCVVTGDDCEVYVKANPEGRDRVSQWEELVFRCGQFSVRKVDILRNDWIGKSKEHLMMHWCEPCLQDWQSKWQEKRVEMWGMLDSIFSV
ncbi:hypothetical protein C8Q80DRAFT_1271284 [Daedaleopsis nitida]|nr:hypothetical protein C8Q80DRAFT_1271284 [Daedaleopsis nitida]